jgi:hypothetical protein
MRRSETLRSAAANGTDTTSESFAATVADRSQRWGRGAASGGGLTTSGQRPMPDLSMVASSWSGSRGSSLYEFPDGSQQDFFARSVSREGAWESGPGEATGVAPPPPDLDRAADDPYVGSTPSTWDGGGGCS